MKTIRLTQGERIVAVVPAPAAGPGWANSVAWVYIGTNDGSLRCECLQPDEQSPQLHTLYGPGAAMCQALVAAVPVRRGGAG